MLLLSPISPSFIAGYIFIGLFLIATILELVFAFLEKELLRKIFKPFCVFFLFLIALMFIPNHPLVYLGALFGMIGDILLIFDNKKLFSLGVFSFLIGHLLYFIDIFIYLFNYEWWIYLIISLSVLLIFVILIKPLSYIIKDKLMNLGASIYFAVLISSLLIISLAVAFNPSSFMYLSLIGYLLFIASDLLLVFVKFKKDISRRDFPIMLSYILAQTLIILGFVLTYLRLEL